MSELARQRLSLEQFHSWVAAQERKYELVDGEPVMMAGANRRHDRIATNTLRVIDNQLQGRDCQPFTSDTFVMQIGNGPATDSWVGCSGRNDCS